MLTTALANGGLIECMAYPFVRPLRLASGPLACVLQSVHGPSQTRALVCHRLGERWGWPAVRAVR